MAPTELLDEHIAVDEDLADVAGVIASNFVIFDPLIFTVILVIEFPDPILQVGGLSIALVIVVQLDLLDILPFLIVAFKLLVIFLMVVVVGPVNWVYISRCLPSANCFFCGFISI